MKALEILKQVSANKIPTFYITQEFVTYANYVNEAITELEALQAPKSCGTCSKKLLCKMAQDVKETYGTKLNEQWFVCYEPKDSK